MNPLKSEIFRYLGYGEKVPDEKIIKIVDECLTEIRSFNSPKYVYKILEMDIKDSIEIKDGFNINSLVLKEHLKDCSKVAVLAATLGTQADLSMNKYNKIDMTKAVVFNACANAYIEEVCDQIEVEIKSNNQLLGLNSVFRFSPGYGDFSLEYQKDILNLLSAAKNIGLVVNESFLLMPTKSVTAVIGFFKGDKDNKKVTLCKDRKCEYCNMKDNCNFSLSKEIKK